MDVSRYCDTEELQLKLEFVTPCFLGSADGKKAELRAAPFKGMIRYWWRVLYGAKYGEKIREVENQIFGSASDSKSHASNVRIEVTTDEKDYVESNGFPKVVEAFSYHSDKSKAPIPINILDYLAYGKYEYVRGSGNVYNSSHIKAGTKFSLNITCNKQYANEVFNAVYALVEYGGIGSRCRNGFGSMRFIETSRKDIKSKIQTLRTITNNLPVDYSSFSNKTVYFRTKRNNYGTWEEALSDIGIVYKSAREALEDKHSFKRRGLLSRPIIVRDRKIRDEWIPENIPPNVKKGRHPKPAIIHVNINGSNKYEGKIMILPMRFYENENEKDYENMIEGFIKNISDNPNIVSITDKLQGGTK